MAVIATRALYIKLGEGNSWAKQAFETDTLRFGFAEISHDVALAALHGSDFTPVADYYRREHGVAPGTATRYSNEVREFYTAGTDVLWITFAEGRLWWCFAEREVFPTKAEDRATKSSKYRKTINHWADKDTKGQTLWTTGFGAPLRPQPDSEEQPAECGNLITSYVGSMARSLPRQNPYERRD
jgi:hypothetical protein